MFARSLLLGLVLASPMSAATVTSFYGDDDGFGLGITSGALPDPSVANASPGEAPFTDVPLGNEFLLATPAFEPTGSFDPFTLQGPILAATLTIRLASFQPKLPVINNKLSFNGLNILPISDVFAGLDDKLDGFDHRIDTLVYDLSENASWIAIQNVLKTGNVSLNGTIWQDRDGFGLFQVDFLKLTIETQDPIAPIPLPASLPILVGALGLLGLASRRRV